MVISDKCISAVRSLWDGRCTVTVRQKGTAGASGRMTVTEVNTITNLPCRISYTTKSEAEQSSGASRILQRIVLYTDRTASIPEGSKITVTQNGVTESYQSSGAPCVYSTHQEIPLSIFNGWA